MLLWRCYYCIIVPHVHCGISTICQVTNSINTSLLSRLRTDPSPCNSTKRQNPPIQQNRRNFCDWKHHFKLFVLGGAVKLLVEQPRFMVQNAVTSEETRICPRHSLSSLTIYVLAGIWQQSEMQSASIGRDLVQGSHIRLLPAREAKSLKAVLYIMYNFCRQQDTSSHTVQYKYPTACKINSQGYGRKNVINIILIDKVDGLTCFV